MATNGNSFRQSDAWKRGQIGEQALRKALLEMGWFVIPSTDYNGGPDNEHAPAMQGQREKFVLPDFDVIAKGKRFWAEVKTKEKADFTRMTGTYDHGIGLRECMHYREVEQRSGCAVWVFIFECSSESLLYAPLTQLWEVGRRYAGDKMNPGGMVFFPRTEFRVWRGRLEDFLEDFKDVITENPPPEPVNIEEVKAALAFAQMRLL